MEEEVGRKGVEEPVADSVGEFFGGGDSVVLVQEGSQRDLRDDRFPVRGLEEGRGW